MVFSRRDSLKLLRTMLTGTALAAMIASPAAAQSTATTATPVKHLVVIFQENVSFDH